MPKPNKKFYVVWVGNKPGIYETWDECKAQTEGFSGAKFKSFPSWDEANTAFNQKPWLPKHEYVKEKKAENKLIGKDHISIFCDGGCDPNPGPSGTGMAVYKRGSIFEHWCGHHESEGTNNRAELFGILEALNYVHLLAGQKIVTSEKKAVIYCDSQYAINCITKWVNGWRKNGWKTQKGQPVLNREIIEAASDRLSGLKNVVEIKKVKAHVGIAGNEAADQLAGIARGKKMTGWNRTYTVK